MMGGDPSMGGPDEGQVVMTVTQLLELIALLTDGSVQKTKATTGGGSDDGEVGTDGRPKKANQAQMIKEIYGALMGGGAPGPGGM